MLESTPGAPYSNKVTDLLTVEGNMRYRFDKSPSWRRPFLIKVPKTFARSETPEAERDPVDHNLLSSPRGPGTVHRPILRSSRRYLESQFVPARRDYQSSCALSVSSVPQPPTVCVTWSMVTEPPTLFRTLTANIRSRRGSKVAINLPIYFDKNTPRPFIDPTIPWERNVYPEDSGKFDSLVWSLR